MSRKLIPQYADKKGSIIELPSIGIIFASFAGAPTASAAGFAPGCIWQDNTNHILYRNDGSKTSATWTVLAGVGDTLTSLTVTTLTATTANITNAVTLASGTTVAGNAVYGSAAPVVIAPASTTLTMTAALHANRVLNLAPTGGLAITPPAATGTGNVYTLACSATVSGGSLTIDAKAGNASDTLNGAAYFVLSGGTTTSTFPTAANSNLITMSGSTTGGVKGTLVTMYDLATNIWIVEVCGLQTGSAATPFSNH